MTAGEMARLHGLAFTHPRPWSEAEIAAMLQSDLYFAVTAEQGFLIGRVVAGEAELLTVAVAPAAQGRGIGRGLVAGFVAEARARGAAQAFLEVAEDNGAARAVYARTGFGESGRRRGYYRDVTGRAVDAILMTLTMVG